MVFHTIHYCSAVCISRASGQKPRALASVKPPADAVKAVAAPDPKVPDLVKENDAKNVQAPPKKPEAPKADADHPISVETTEVIDETAAHSLFLAHKLADLSGNHDAINDL